MCFDDNVVQPVEDTSKIVSQEAYCLFYQQRAIDRDEVLQGDPVDIAEVDEKNTVGHLPPDKVTNGAGNGKRNENCLVM